MNQPFVPRGIELGIQAWPSDIDHLKWLREVSCRWSNHSVLDLGCGSGYVPQYLAATGARKVIGVDIVVPKQLDLAQGWTFSTMDLEVPQWSSEAIRLMGSPAQLILAFDILEHLTSPFQFLQNCHSVLENGGKVILTTPNVNSWERILRPLNWSGARDPQHKILFTKYSLEFALRKSGFEIEYHRAPLRKAGPMSRFLPDIGGQLLLSCRRL